EASAGNHEQSPIAPFIPLEETNVTPAVGYLPFASPVLEEPTTKQGYLSEEVSITEEFRSVTQASMEIKANQRGGGDDEQGNAVPERIGYGLSPFLQEQLKSLEGAMVEKVSNSRPKIQMVPYILRKKENFVKYYKPVVLALGPIHHYDTDLEESEKLKLLLAGHFIKKNAVNKEDLCNKILMKIECLKACYAENLLTIYSDEQLTWMFLVDGCAVLCFIQCLVVEVEGGKKVGFRYDKLNALNVKIDRIPFIIRDLFLLENQLPYQLLLLICSVTANSERLIGTIKMLAAERAGAEAPPSPESVKGGEPHHLLDLLRDYLVVKHEDSSKEEKLPCSNRQAQNTSSHEQQQNGKEKKPQYSNQYTFRNVAELKASGIEFKRSKTNSLKAISFDPSWFLGTVKLPLLRVSDDSAPTFLNLIAYEMCPDFKNEYDVTSYMCFLDSLIDQPEDVAELRKANILHNLFGSDEEVASLFNEIATDLVPNPKFYGDVKEQIEDVFQNKW
ncbi:hypothetical protein Tsubulata_046689, partial [Turnera subulata]